jgi:hypothetical protein
MARFEYTKTVEHYSFNPPRMVSEEDFRIMKMKIKMNPEARLIDEKEAEKKHEHLSLLVFFGLVAMGIGLIGMFSNDNPPGWSIVLLLISLFGVLHPLLNMGTYESSKNYIRAERERVQYFRKLKNIVNESPDYYTFAEKNKRFIY